MSCNDNQINKEVSIEYPLFQSQKGRYFIGETPLLKGTNSLAVAALVNPSDSYVNIYLNAITVTNISNSPLSAEIYLDSTPPGGTPSTNVRCTNLSFSPAPQPYGEIQSNGIVKSPPSNGVSIFSRIVSPNSTTVIDGGQIILAPKSCVLVYLGGYLPVTLNSTIVAFGWWEEKIFRSCFNDNFCN